MKNFRFSLMLLAGLAAATACSGTDDGLGYPER